MHTPVPDTSLFRIELDHRIMATSVLHNVCGGRGSKSPVRAATRRVALEASVCDTRGPSGTDRRFGLLRYAGLSFRDILQEKPYTTHVFVQSSECCAEKISSDSHYRFCLFQDARLSILNVQSGLHAPEDGVRFVRKRARRVCNLPRLHGLLWRLSCLGCNFNSGCRCSFREGMVSSAF